jgi:spermidine/putrescine transport system permease protein
VKKAMMNSSTESAGRASTTLPMQIYSMIRFGITPEINALATIVMAVSITALTLSQRLNRGVIGQ